PREVLVLTRAEAVALHHHTASESGVVVEEPREGLALGRREQRPRPGVAPRRELGFDRRSVERPGAMASHAWMMVRAAPMRHPDLVVESGSSRLQLDQAVQDQAVEAVIRGPVAPPEKGVAARATLHLPGIAGKPGELHR